MLTSKMKRQVNLFKTRVSYKNGTLFCILYLETIKIKIIVKLDERIKIDESRRN